MKQPGPVQAAVNITLIYVLLVNSGYAHAQTPDYEGLRKVVFKWNEAVNSRNSTALRSLYADRLAFYGRNQKRSTCIFMKQDFWRKNPQYAQKIIPPMTFKTYTSGATKCEFIKEVMINAKPYRFKAYLILVNRLGKYEIIGESDAETDKRLNFTLDLGQEVPTEPPITKAEAKAQDSTGPNHSFPSPVESNPLLDQIQAMLGGSVTVTMPRLYLAAGSSVLLVTTLLLLFFRRSTTARTFDPAPVIERRPFRRRNSVPDASDDQAFIDFVLTLFDPLFFRVLRVDRANPLSPIEIEFRHKDNTARFAIQCKYLGGEVPKMMKVASTDVYQQFESETGTELYLISGAGGDPGNPREVYMIPVRQLQVEMGHDEIARFKKFGMFFYNSAQKKLQ